MDRTKRFYRIDQMINERKLVPFKDFLAQSESIAQFKYSTGVRFDAAKRVEVSDDHLCLANEFQIAIVDLAGFGFAMVQGRQRLNPY